MIVTPCFSIASMADDRVEALDQHARSTPATSARPSTTLSPKMWNSGSTPNATSLGAADAALGGAWQHLLEVREQVAVGEHGGLGAARRCRCVKTSTARSSSSRSTTGDRVGAEQVVEHGRASAGSTPARR